jgi:hypothetical protein
LKCHLEPNANLINFSGACLLALCKLGHFHIESKNTLSINFSGLYYKHITIVNDDSGVINKLQTSLTEDAKVINYDRHMFKVQATAVNVFIFLITYVCPKISCIVGTLQVVHGNFEFCGKEQVPYSQHFTAYE